MKIKFTDMSLDFVKLEFFCAVLAGVFLMLAAISYAFDHKAFIPLAIVFAFLMWLAKMMEFAESFEEKRIQILTSEQRLPYMCRRQTD